MKGNHRRAGPVAADAITPWLSRNAVAGNPLPVMRQMGRGSDGGEPGPAVTRGRHRVEGRSAGHSSRARPKVFGALMSSVIVVLTGIAWLTYHDVSTGITTTAALDGAPPSIGVDQNILIVGLDSRRDQQGQPLPQDILGAMHAGDESSGNYDADVLIVVHMPAGDGPVIAISIPRDDYVDLPGCPTSECRGKIKAAYRLAYESVMNSQGTGDLRSPTASADAPDVAAREQLAREAGRKAQISAVKHLLQIPIDHFVEITLGAFFQIARVVEPIKVCLNEDTADRFYSGADFHKGVQEINAAQAMGFVRQRRDANDAMFTDLDRTRRQQAFMASVVTALRHGGALSSPRKLHALLDVAKQNVAIDAGFDLAGLIPYASAAIDRSVKFYTLPVTDFRTLSDGEDVNIIDAATIRSLVHSLLASDSTSTIESTDNVRVSVDPWANPEPTAHRVALDVVNASGRDGAATAVRNALAKGEFTEGTVGTADSISSASSIAYGTGAQPNAELLADKLGLSATASDAVAPDAVLVTVGTDFHTSEYVDSLASTSDATTTSEAPSLTTVPATAGGTAAPTPTNLTLMTAGTVPCVR
jgi:LCP family protein required for cell wall assembly